MDAARTRLIGTARAVWLRPARFPRQKGEGLNTPSDVESCQKIHIRKLEERDFDSLANDLNLWRLKERGRAYLEWLRQCKPFEGVSRVAALGDKIIGYYITVTVPLKVGDRVVLSYRGGIFIRSDHRKKSRHLFHQLIRTLFHEYQKKQSAMYAFPRFRMIKYLTQKIGCVSLKSIPRYVYRVRGACLFERFLKRIRPQPKEWAIQKIHFFDKRFDALWDQASKAHPILAVRNAEFLNWRYLKEPGEQYLIFAAERSHKIEGYIVLKPSKDGEPRTGLIMDLFDTQDPGVTQALIRQAVEYYKTQNIDKIEMRLSHEYTEGLLRSAGFLKAPIRSNGAETLLAKCDHPAVEKDFFCDPNNWFITTTDMIIA